MPEKEEMTKKAYDLEERTTQFSEKIIEFTRNVPKNTITLPLISQLIRSTTSIGSNYCEADDAESRKDFKHKVGIAKKEARETKYWLRLIGKAEPSLEKEVKILWQEAKELHLILNAIVHSTEKNSVG